MNYEKGKQYTFPVNEVMLKPLWGKLYFNIVANGSPVRVLAMEFQRENNPTELKCICTSDNPQNLKFEQDRSVLLPQIYQPGGIYEFKVVSDKPVNGAYRLQDGNGWPFRLVNKSREKLMRYSVVKCQVLAINGTDLELALVQDKKTEKVPVLSPEEVVALDTTGGTDRKLMARLLGSNPAFADALNEYEQGNPMWVLLAVEAVHLNISEWMNLNSRNAVPLLNSVRAICLSLLQTAGFLDSFAMRQREDYRQRLIRTILHTEDYLEALSLVEAGLEQKYIDETLELIQNATFIFRPERRMHVLMSIFTIKVAYVSAYIHQIFRIIKARHGSAGFMSLFKEAFIDMLDLYILNAPKFVISDSKASVKDMVEALAIQLLLTSNRMHVSFGIYRTKLYRYASMLVSGDETVALLDRAYDMVLSPSDSDLGISWADLDNVGLMAHALAVKKHDMSAPDTVYAFEGHNAALTLDGRCIRLMPTVKSVTKWIPALPAHLFPDYDIQIQLNERLSEKAGGVGRSIPKAHRLWDELEKVIFSPVTVVVKRQEEKQKSLPAVGQQVMVRVVDKELIDKDQRFNCVIEEEEFCGSGFFRRENIVRYPVRINAEHFMSENGDPYLIKATVMEVGADGKVEFTLRPGLNSCAEGLAEDMRLTADDCYATITGGDEPGSRGYLCVSTDGFPLNIPKSSTSEKLVKGDRIITSINEVKYNRRAETLYVNATFKDYADEEPLDQYGLFNELSDAVQSLIAIYADGRIYAGQPEEIAEQESSQKPTEYIDPDDLREAILVMSSRGAEYSDYFTSYNWLAVTRIMALMLGDREEAGLLARRMELIRAIDNFGNNGRPDHATLGPLLEQCRRLRDKDPDINIKLGVLNILSSLDRPASDQLHIPSATIDGGRLNKMARLAVAYNALRGTEFTDEQIHLRRGLYSLAGLEYNATADSAYVTVADSEDQTTEFKSSLIFPAGNKMKPDEKKQMTEIMQIVCGFLNSRQGGTLYIGVDNFGQPIGLESDFTQINGRNRNYDVQLMRDQFDLRFRNGFYDHFGVTPGGYNLSADNVITSFEEYDKNMVYIVKVLSAPEAVTMTDGSMFVRQGTSTRPIVGEDNQQKFRIMRGRQRI